MKFPYSLINRVGGLYLRMGLPRRALEADALMDQAIRAAGLSDFGDDHFRDGLEAALAATREVDFHFIGRATFQHVVRRHLVNRLRFVEAAKRLDPASVDLVPPLIVTGIPRSGTTHLHRLLALDPAHRELPLWELLEPIAPPGGEERSRRRLERELRAIPKLLPELDAKHYARADEPEECVLLLGNSFVSPLFWYVAPIYDYLAFWTARDKLATYREYAAQLRLLQARHPGQRLVLKAPAHLGALAELGAVLQDALIVQTHRDPVACMKSVNSLQATLHRLVTDAHDLPRMGQVNVELYASAMDKGLAALEAAPGRAHHVAFAGLAADPIATVRAIYVHFELPFTEAVESTLATYVADHPRHKHGVHRYQPDPYGMSDEAVAERFSSYRRRFADLLSAGR